MRRLVVFVGGCTLEAAAAAVDPDGTSSIVAGITALVENSLLRPEDGSEGQPCFPMRETVREFGLERLAECGEEADTRYRHAVWSLAFAMSRRLGRVASPTLYVPGPLAVPAIPANAFGTTCSLNTSITHPGLRSHGTALTVSAWRW